ncbi:unnamed protein product, partial [Laminaria digitata]
MRRAKAAIEAGASVNGPSEQPFAPIVIAAMADNAGMVGFLLGQGADPDRPVTNDVPCPTSDIAAKILGERTLHIAARSGKIEIVRLLLERSRADPNAADGTGYTPLMATCESAYDCVELVRLLLEAGADP